MFNQGATAYAGGKTWSVPDLAGAVDVAVARRPGGLGELQFVEPGVDAALREQLGVAADLGDAAALEHHDAVGALDGGEPVRDDDGGAPAHQGEVGRGACRDRG